MIGWFRQQDHWGATIADHLKGSGTNGEIGFLDVVQACMNSAEFMAEYRRLTGEMIREERTPIDMMIDEATGHMPYDDGEVVRFAARIYDLVWLRLPAGAFVGEVPG